MSKINISFFSLSMMFLASILLIGCNSKGKASKEKEILKIAETAKPNIIYILADDLGYGDLSLTGQKNFKTPHIDKLAAEGMFFTQHYSGSTVCAPSRSSLLTGKHTGHTFVRGNKEIQPEGQHPLTASAITLPKVLKDAGYVTGAFGKWGLGFPGSEGDPNFQGFDEFYGYNCQRQGHHYYPYHLWHNQEKQILEGNKQQNTDAYAPELIHDQALEFIETNKDKPFFMFYPSIIPHAELAAPESYMGKHRDKFIPETEFEGVDEGEGYKIGEYGSQKEPHTAFAAMVSLLDDQVGEIRAKLEELGIAENTLIIFTSDNGPHMEGGADPDFFDSNADLKGYKRDLYEGGIRVPMIAYWPQTIKAGVKSEHISAFWDVLPTICDMTQLSTPSSTDGISFLPTLLGKEQPTHEYLYWEFHELGGRQAVRMGDWKGVRLNMTDNPDAPIQLYNLTNDIGEQNDVAEENLELVQRMAKIMDEAHVPSAEFQFEYEKK